MEDQLIYLVLAGVFGLFMAWGIGANDVANAMATSIGSGALTIRQALLVAAVFEFAGAVLAGGEVTSTIRQGIVDSSFVVGFGYRESSALAGEAQVEAIQQLEPQPALAAVAIGALVNGAAVP